ncbi:hypothetical protein IB642_06730 [Allofrancisella guangzhouensis]|uniref:hypothetical protein n=1 Tax=Allofrancisella guangzhouensis TaxID=594679 RepID=UPI0012FD3AE2|nr:hypothetical protein [Allofrancisella guangzhouensis]MBK2027263.1 hypothetical protein [Allofrancisella guangzhouensis]MBK2044717.1 hypothetical protein [Allofrancisella guangzhouensis]MBK2045941.1 hypothetical protein [Allofrancisella guangzhouensis]
MQVAYDYKRLRQTILIEEVDQYFEKCNRKQAYDKFWRPTFMHRTLGFDVLKKS